MPQESQASSLSTGAARASKWSGRTSRMSASKKTRTGAEAASTPSASARALLPGSGPDRESTMAPARAAIRRRAVGRAVVHHEHPPHPPGGPGRRHHPGDRGLFVAGGDDHVVGRHGGGWYQLPGLWLGKEKLTCKGCCKDTGTETGKRRVRLRVEAQRISSMQATRGKPATRTIVVSLRMLEDDREAHPHGLLNARAKSCAG